MQYFIYINDEGKFYYLKASYYGLKDNHEFTQKHKLMYPKMFASFEGCQFFLEKFLTPDEFCKLLYKEQKGHEFIEEGTAP